MLLALVLTTISVSSGTLLSYAYEEECDLPTRIAQGIALGLAGLGFLGFVFSALLGLTLLAVVAASACLILITYLVVGSRAWPTLRTELGLALERARCAVSSHRKQFIGIGLAVVIFSSALWQVFDRSMFYRDRSMYTGVANDFGDLPFHLTVITRFVYGGNIPPEDPVYAGTRFTYPYLADFIAAIMVRAGASLRGAMLLEGLLLMLSLVWLVAKWSLELTQDSLAALISPVLVLFGSGVGFIMIFKEAKETELGLLSVVLRPLHDYAMVSRWGLRWGDSLTSLLVTQRSLLLGLPLALIIFRQWWKAAPKALTARDSAAGRESSPAPPGTGEAAPGSRRGGPSSLRVDIPLAAAGVIAGFLPVCHTHTYLVVMIVGGCMAIASRNWRAWASFFVPAVLLGASQAWSISHDSAAQFRTFFGLYPGWESSGQNFIWFWFKNTGLLIPLMVFGLVRWRGERLVPKRLMMYYLPFVVCFIVPNLVKLAPWTWDNMKVLFYWYLASVPLAALVLARLWSAGHWRRALSVMLLISLAASGCLNAIRVISRSDSYAIFDADQMAFAELIKRDTPMDALILHAPVHDDPVFLTGRRSLMGYPGHVWTHGIDYEPRDNDIKRIYEGGPGAEDLIAHYKIQYAVVSPQERNLMKVDDSFFGRFGKVAEVGEYCLYRTR